MGSENEPQDGRARRRHQLADGTPVSADPDPARARDAVAAVAAELAGPAGSIHIEPLGIAGEVKQPLAAAGSAERLAADLPGRRIDQLVIAGDLDHCADRIAALAGQGIDPDHMRERRPAPGARRQTD